MDSVAVRMPRPRRALLWLMVAMGCLWVMFAASLNWTSAPAAAQLFEWVAGDSNAVLHGQVWRLVTAALLNDPQHPGPVAIVLMLLFFFGASLQDTWGERRLLGFMAGSAAFAYALETLASFIPGMSGGVWYGGMVLADAITVAWAIQNRHATVRLFLFVPVRAMVMVALLVVWHVALVIARKPGSEGLVAPFGAMLAGWLLSDASPLRKLWLRGKLARVQRQLDGLKHDRARRIKAGPDLRVIRGGSDDEDSEKRVLH
jgi:hypothetical protein